MVNLYVDLYKAGEITLDDIKNVKIREKVRQRLVAEGWITE